MERAWVVELLGGLAACREGVRVERFRTRRVASLLAYLAFHQSASHPRESVAQVLWPEADDATARRNLRQALSSLRNVLEPVPWPAGSVLVTHHDRLQLRPETLTTDIALFESAAEQGRIARDPDLLRRALDLYKGDLLPGFFEDWVWSQRLRLEDLYLSSLRVLAELEDTEGAIGPLRKGAIREPFEEKWHLELMRRYLKLGSPERALAQYADLQDVLADSFGLPPSAEAKSLAARARAMQALGPETRPSAIVPAMPPPRRKVVLPVFANRYFGREAQIELVCEFVADRGARLVTVLGPAGVGKTRLTVRCGAEIAERKEWNVWFVPLADRLNAREIPDAIVAAIEPRQAAAEDPLSSIADLLQGRPTLLVLDNAEQIADEAGPWVASLLERIPNVACLVSSRQPLQIAMEQVVPLEPLPVPRDVAMDLQALAAIPSVQLFLDRCQALRPDLRLTERNAAAVAELCSRLEGLPLAIEIVAGLAGAFSPVQMLHHLPERLNELTRRGKDVPDRHRSLRAAIDWSYEWLAPELRRHFWQLSVFRGGFTADAAVVVTGNGDVLEQLLSLQERSLIFRATTEEGRPPRFSMLVAFREYAEEHADPEALRQARDRHATYFASRQLPARPFTSPGELEAHHRIVEEEIDNIFAAIEFSLAEAELGRAVQLMEILAARWPSRSVNVTERRLVRAILAHTSFPNLDARSQTSVLRMTGTTHIRSGDYDEAYRTVQRAVAIAEADGSPDLIATTLSGLSICTAYQGRQDETLALCRQVLQLVGPEPSSLAERSYLGIGSIMASRHEYADAAAAFERARAISARLRGGEPDPLIVTNQARIALDQGRMGEALRLIYDAIRISRRVQGIFTLAVALMVLTRYHLRLGNLDAAKATNLEALDKFRQGDFHSFVLQSLRMYGLVLAQGEDPKAGVTLFAATEEVSALDSELDPDGGPTGAMERLRRELPSMDVERAWAQGVGMDRRTAVRFVTDHR